MSAWIVSKRHVDLLVTAILEDDPAHTIDPHGMGTMLWTECHNSVNYCYSEHTAVPTYYFQPVSPLPADIVVLKQIRCYNYQSSEHPDWENSMAQFVMERLKERLERRLGLTPDQVSEQPEYSAAPWGWDE